MIGWLLDTNVAAELIRPQGAARVKRWAADQDETTFHLSILAIGGYEKGIANLPEADPRRPVFAATRDRLMDRFAGRLLPVSDVVVRRWGVIAGTVRRQTGHPPPVVDTLLAATAPESGLTLVTRNTRDVLHSGAALFNPWEDEPGTAPLLPRRRGRRAGDP